MDKTSLELVLVVAMMIFLFIFGVAAVLIFYRTWRREQRAKRAEIENPTNAPRGGDRP